MPAPEGSSSRLSPPNVSALLDISLPGPPEDVLSQGEPATHISDSIIEIAISSGQYGEGRGARVPSFLGPRGPDLLPGVCTLAGHAPVLSPLWGVEGLLPVGVAPVEGPQGLCSPRLREGLFLASCESWLCGPLEGVGLGPLGPWPPWLPRQLVCFQLWIHTQLSSHRRAFSW